MKLKNTTIFLIVIQIFTVLTFNSCERQQFNMPVMQVTTLGIKLSEAQIQLANIKVDQVTNGVLKHQLHLSGVLKVDESSVSSISARSEGRIEQLYFKNTGEPVNAGDALYDIFSEDLISLAREYQGIHDNNGDSNRRPDIELDAENRLLLKGLLPSQIAEVARSGYIPPVFTIYSPQRGLIRYISVTEGEFVGVGQRLFELADNSRLWVETQVYPNELHMLKPGMAAEVFINGAFDSWIPNRIDFINPAFEPGTNITIIRTIIDNPGKRLRPGMLALLNINTDQKEGIIIPVSSLLIDNKGYHAWIQNEDRSFSARDLTLGIQTTDSVLVTSGLEESDKVVVSGAYLLNSEKILKKSYECSTTKGMQQ